MTPTPASTRTDAGQLWSCGPDCRHALPVRGPDCGWHVCAHPDAGGRLGHESLDCPRFDSRPWIGSPWRPEVRIG